MKAVILAGGNTARTPARLEQAAAELEKLGTLTHRSGQYPSKSWGFEATDFLNQAFELETELPPESLLDALQTIENRDRAHEDKKNQRYASRDLDLDILFYGDQTIDTPRLTVPHPLLPERVFALRPLCEWMPDYRHPTHKSTIKEMMKTLLLIAAIGLVSCFKQVNYNTRLSLQVGAKNGTATEILPSDSTRVFAFAADTVQWDVLTWQDAVAGHITHKKTGEVQEAVAVGTPDTFNDRPCRTLALNGRRYMLLPASLRDTIYGVTMQPIGENLPQIVSAVTFSRKDVGGRYVRGKWLITNALYVAPNE